MWSNNTPSWVAAQRVFPSEFALNGLDYKKAHVAEMERVERVSEVEVGGTGRQGRQGVNDLGFILKPRELH